MIKKPVAASVSEWGKGHSLTLVATPRAVLIANHHPRLRLDCRALARAIHTLDATFEARGSVRKSSAGKSKFENRNSKITPAVAAGDLSLVFLTDPALAKLHADFLADPTPTDVITFAGDPAANTAGEICVSVDAALRQLRTSRPIAHLPRRSSAKAGHPSPIAFSAELTLYLVHGWLHLAGYDDLQPAKKRAMRRAEARALRLLRAANALPRFALRDAGRDRLPRAKSKGRSHRRTS